MSHINNIGQQVAALFFFPLVLLVVAATKLSELGPTQIGDVIIPSAVFNSVVLIFVITAVGVGLGVWFKHLEPAVRYHHHRYFAGKAHQLLGLLEILGYAEEDALVPHTSLALLLISASELAHFAPAKHKQDVNSWVQKHSLDKEDVTYMRSNAGKAYNELHTKLREWEI